MLTALAATAMGCEGAGNRDTTRWSGKEDVFARSAELAFERMGICHLLISKRIDDFRRHTRMAALRIVKHRCP